MFNTYGPVSNEHLLIHYGFALENNIDDEISVSVEVPIEVQNSKEEYIVYDNKGIHHIRIPKDGSLSPDALYAARVITNAKNLAIIKDWEPLPCKLEAKALNFLRDHLEAKLAQYPNTLAVKNLIYIV